MSTEIEWSFVNALIDIKSIDNFEKEKNIKIPHDLKNTIKRFNAGQPSRCIFDTDSSTGNVFGALLSFNPSDNDNIYEIFSVVNAENKSVMPFAADPFGNYLCLMNEQVVFWDHETNSTEFVAPTFSELLNKLYITEEDEETDEN